MKKRNRSRRQQFKAIGRGWLGAPTKRAQRDRRAWTFERLEDRYYFSAAPLTGLEGFQWLAVSNSTPEGQQLIDAIQQSWYSQAWDAQVAANGASSGGGQLDTGGQSEIPRYVPYSVVPNDPYFDLQWHLLNVGQIANIGFQEPDTLYGVPGEDINVVPAWAAGYTGAGVKVAVVDTGVELDHPDLADNISLQYAFDAIRNQPGGSPFGSEFGVGHGTSVAGIIAAVGNNGVGGTGIAYDATIIPIRFLGAGATNETLVNAITANGAPADIYNHSWGPNFAFYGRSVNAEDPTSMLALSNSARLGRDGLGAIHVFAAGNSNGELHSPGSNMLVNSRYTIGVGIVDHDGQVGNSDGTSTTYGEMGPSVLVVAPSGSDYNDIVNDPATGSGIVTTDLTGDTNGGGFNVPPLPNGLELDFDKFPDDTYTSRFNGTSAAAPMVSGVIALMLQANPNLTYRDVEEILLRSARQDQPQDPAWIVNYVPLFRDPQRHFGDQWNDEIAYTLVPGTIVDPAVQAASAPVVIGDDMGTPVTFQIAAVADGFYDGWVGNNLTVVFRKPATLPGENYVYADLVESKIRVTVAGDTTTWGDIEAAIEGLLGATNIDVTVSNPDTPFTPAQYDLWIPMFGGEDATALETTLARAQGYGGYHPLADPILTPDPKSPCLPTERATPSAMAVWAPAATMAGPTGW